MESTEINRGASSRKPRQTLMKRGERLASDLVVDGVLGSGGMATVYLVSSETTGSRYAAKAIRHDLLSNGGIRERFLAELETWLRMGSNPYVVRAFHVLRQGSDFVVLLEYVEGQNGLVTLADYITAGPLDLDWILFVAIQFCYGMEWANGQGLRCHRDIKPTNILISGGTTVRITDFGLTGMLDVACRSRRPNTDAEKGSLASDTEELATQSGVLLGTPAYMPPEQFVHPSSCDERSDIYSFGLVLFQMVTDGHLPFVQPKASDALLFRLMYEIHQTFEMPPISSPLSPIIKQCLARPPERRYARFEDLRYDLERMRQEATGVTFTPLPPYDSNPVDLSNRGASLVAIGAYRPAEEYLRAAINADNGYALAMINLAELLRRQGRFREAGQYWRMAEHADPDIEKKLRSGRYRVL